jgi:hypothetical protein
MKTTQKLWLLYIVFFISALPCCVTKHDPISIKPKMTVGDATKSLKETIKASKQHPFRGDIKAVTDIDISKQGITIVKSDNKKIFYAFNDIVEPSVIEDPVSRIYFVRFKQDLSGNCIVFTNLQSATIFADALYYLKHYNDPDVKQERERENEDCLRQVHNTPVDQILAGATATDLNLPCSGVPQDKIETALNNIMVEWKNKGFRSLIQQSTASQLNDLIIKMEKAILNLDHKVRQLKDLADEEARQVQVPGQAAPEKKAPELHNVAHLLEQRKTILMVMLGSVKQVAAQRATTGRVN